MEEMVSLKDEVAEVSPVIYGCCVIVCPALFLGMVIKESAVFLGPCVVHGKK